MKKLSTITVAAWLAALSGCGGGTTPTPDDAYRALLDQVSMCVSVQAGTKPASDFDALAAIVASAPVQEVCHKWSPAMLVRCDDAYALYSKPFAGRCVRP